MKVVSLTLLPACGTGLHDLPLTGETPMVENIIYFAQ